MKRKTVKNRSAITLIELMITIMVASIVMLSIGFLLVDNQRGYNRMYGRVLGEVVTDAYVTRKAFDATCRKASAKKYRLGLDGDFIEVYYYQDVNSPEIDRYASFYRRGDELMVDYGVVEAETWNIKSPFSTVRLAKNVRAVTFSADACSVRMVLRLDNGREAMTVTTSAVRHNE